MLQSRDLALVWVQTEDGANRLGTAYAVTDALVLTARHVSHGNHGEPAGKRIKIRFVGEIAWRDADEAWASPKERNWDASLLRLREPRHRHSSLAWGEHDRSADVAYESCGYPGAAVATHAEDAVLREVADVRGNVLRHGGLAQGLCELTVEAAPPQAALWSGLSGAPVFADGRLIAVIRSVPSGFGGERLWAVPVARLLENDQFAALVGNPVLRWVPVSVLMPGNRDLPAIIGPAALLGTPYCVVPFFEPSRTREIDWLRRWVTSPSPFDIHLFTGPGGAGKTRLFIEWCRRLSAQHAPDGKRWEAGFLPENTNEAQIHALLTRELPLFLVIDYAETWQRLRDVLHQLVHARGLVRVALLARNSGDWWQALGDDGDVMHDVVALPGVVSELAPIGLEGNLRQCAFNEAYRAFARQQGKLEEPPAAPALEDPRFERMLYIHMAALAALAGEAVAADLLLDWVIERGQRVWKRWALVARSEHAQQLFVQQARRAVAALTLVGGAPDLEQAAELLRRAGGPEPADGFANFLHQLYPGREPEGARAAYVTGLEPDLLGEVLVARVLTDASTSVSYLDRVFHNADEAAVRAGFTVLGRIALARRAPGAETWLARLLDADMPGRTAAALDVALAMGEETAFAPLGQVLATSLRRGGDVGIAKQLEGKLPNQTVALRELAVWVYETLVAALPLPMSDDTRAERGGLLHRLGIRHSQMGNLEEALRATREAVEIRRKLSEQNPDVFLPALARSLNNLGNRYSELRQHLDAVVTMTEAVEHYRKLSEQEPDVFLPALAGSLNNLGDLYSQRGWWEALETTTMEAVEVIQKMPEQKQNAFLPDLAKSLYSLSNRPSGWGLAREMLEATRTAVELLRKLSKRKPDAFLPDLAESLNNLGRRCSEGGMAEEALEATREAVEILRQLSKQRPDAFLPDLAESLNNLGNRYSEAGMMEEALEATRKAVEHYRNLSGQQQNMFLANLATCLDNLGWMYTIIGKHEEAMEATREAVEICRKLSEQVSIGFRVPLASSLYRLSNRYIVLGKHEEAMEATREAEEICRKLSKSGVSPPDSSEGLYDLGITYEGVSRPSPKR